MIVHIRLNDECKNKICDFAITADIYKLRCKTWEWFSGGCCHQAILKHAPQYKCFIDLHNCNHYGHPTHVIDNANYWFRQKKYEVMKELLRLEDGELEPILLVADDKVALQYQLKQLGIIDRWHQEAIKAIDYLNELTGCRWINPYLPEEEKFVIKPLTEEE